MARTRFRSRALIVACVALVSAHGCTCAPARPQTFATAADAVGALDAAAKAGSIDGLLGIFGHDATDLVASSDPATARHNREVFTTAMAEGWRLADNGPNGKVLVIGHEQWPFPVPLVKGDGGWHFDTAAGREEVIARRIGRNELAVISLCRTYVAAQRLYASRPHDGQPAGLYAPRFRSDRGRENGLFWPAARGERRSPLGDLVAQAAEEGRPLGEGAEPAPFHGYYFRIIDAQGEAAPGGAKSYVANGRMSGGFALVAWPAHYDVTGVMTFIVNQDGTVYEKDLGPDTEPAERSMLLYNPDTSWGAVR